MSAAQHGGGWTRGPGPLLVLLPALILAIVLALFFRRPPTLRRLDPPDVSDPDEAVPALFGSLCAADGSALAARLTPMHADPVRQSFEAATLRRRLDLPEGEPWRLSLRWDPPSDPGGGAASGRLGSGGPARGEAVPERAELALGPVRIDDEQGLALAALEERAFGGAAESARADPLRALFGPPAGGLRSGQAADWILWGRAPGAGARLVGLLPPADAPDADDFERSTGLRGPLLLVPSTVRRSELVLPVARLDRAVPGKIQARTASEEDRGSAAHPHR